jgi:hypothetical protein
VGSAAVENLSAAVAGNWHVAHLDASGVDADLRDRVLAELPEAVAAVRAADRGNGVLVAPDHRLASLLQSFLYEHGALTLEARLAPAAARDVAGRRFEEMFDSHDVAGWVFKFLPAWLKGRFTKQPFVTPGDGVSAIGDTARIAVLGDWGTGLYGAPVCAATIEGTAPAYDAVMHLGDTYYAGTATEVANRLLAAWPRVDGASNWSLNANHEMYSGGEGYFGETLKDPRFKQKSSCFAFQNQHFLFLGLDTAYEDEDLSADQLAWIGRRVSEAGARKLVLFTHHQPFSQFETAGPRIGQKLGPLLATKRVFAWYWGHEHRCVVFDRHDGWGVWGRCIGHSGYPAFRDTFRGEPDRHNGDGSAWYRVARTGAPPALALDGPNRYIPGEEARYSPNGFLSLDLDGPSIHETVHAPDGTPLFVNTLESA